MGNKEQNILLIDDEESILESLEITLNMGGYGNTLTCNDSRKVVELLSNTNVDLLIVDYLMPHLTGRDVIEAVVERFPDVPIIVITGVNEIETAVDCIRMGAVDYMVKPVEKNRLLSGVKRALELRGIEEENIALKKQLLSGEVELRECFSKIITRNSKMNSIFQYLEATKKSLKPILITGETGVGKELVAKAIHDISAVSGQFIPVNVAGLDDQMFSDTLFGHVKGSFTGAEKSRKGLIEQASGGTIFLDEIGELNNTSQVKLLRLLQQGEYLPIGSDDYRITDARIICATNLEFPESINSGKFRKDLYYRLRTHHVKIPPLRDRRDDLPVLTEHFMQKSSEELEKKVPGAPSQLYHLLSNYSFPGNVRELEAMVHDAVSRYSSGTMSLEVFKEALFIEREDWEGTMDLDDLQVPENMVFSDQLPTLKQAEERLIREAIKRSGGNQTLASQLLGISRQTLIRRLKTLDL